MRATRCCRWALVLALVVAAPASAAQVIAPRDVAARLAVGPDGRAFVVSPSARPGASALSSIRRRAARPGAAFGPSRALMRPAAGAPLVDAGVAADGSGVIIVQAHRSVRAVTFGPSGALGSPGRAVGARRARRLRGVGGRAQRRGGRRVVPPPRRGALAPGGGDARARRAQLRRARAALGVRAPPVLHERVRRDRGARRRRRDVELHGAPRRLGGAAAPGAALRPAAAAGRRRERRPAGGRRRGRRGGGDLQHPARARCARATACNCTARRPRVRSGRPSTSTAAAGVTVGRRRGHARGPRAGGLVRPGARRARARLRGGADARRWPPPPSWAPTCARSASRVAADDAGRAVVAWSQRGLHRTGLPRACRRRAARRRRRAVRHGRRAGAPVASDRARRWPGWFPAAGRSWRGTPRATGVRRSAAPRSWSRACASRDTGAF